MDAFDPLAARIDSRLRPHAARLTPKTSSSLNLGHSTTTEIQIDPRSCGKLQV